MNRGAAISQHHVEHRILDRLRRRLVEQAGLAVGGFDAILIEREAEYVADIRRRIAWAQGEGRLTAQEMAKKPDLGLEGLSLFE